MFKKMLFLICLCISNGGVYAEECKDIVIQLTDDDPNPAIKSPKTYMILDCHEGTGTYHSGTTINFIHYSGGKICHGHRVCGNVKGIEGEVRIGAAWDFVTARLADLQAAATNGGGTTTTTTGDDTTGDDTTGDDTTAQCYYDPLVHKCTGTTNCQALPDMSGCYDPTLTNSAPSLLTSMNNAPEWIRNSVGYIPGEINNYPEYGSCTDVYPDGSKPIYSGDGICGLPPHTCVTQADYDSACGGGSGTGTGTGTSGTGTSGYSGYNSYSSYPVRNGVFAEFKTSFKNLQRYCSKMQDYSCITPGNFR